MICLKYSTNFNERETKMKDISVIIQVVVILAVTGLIVVLVNHFFNRFIARREKLYQKFIKSILTFIIIVIGVYAALSQFEIARTISTSLLQSGSLIIAVATFAAQQALGNVISGFFISATKPCEIGQKVKIMSGGNVIAEGIVRDMTVRHIFIEQFDGQNYIVPNSLADSSVIVNTNFVEDVGNYIEIEVGYDTDVEEARKIIQKICDEDPRILHNQKTKVLVSAITANGMLLKFTIWSKDLNDSFEACSNVRQRLVSEFLKAGITIPYQTFSVEKI